MVIPHLRKEPESSTVFYAHQGRKRYPMSDPSEQPRNSSDLSPAQRLETPNTGSSTPASRRSTIWRRCELASPTKINTNNVFRSCANSRSGPTNSVYEATESLLLPIQSLPIVFLAPPFESLLSGLVYSNSRMDISEISGIVLILLLLVVFLLGTIIAGSTAGLW